MDLWLFARGLALGLAVAAPIGPMSLLCMRRTLASGFRAGFVSGLGVASADAVFGTIAALGLVAVTDFLVGQQPWLRVLGGLMIAWLGLGAIRTPPSRATDGASGGLAQGFASMFLLTLANPATILSFVALFAGVGVGDRGPEVGAPLLLVPGVFLGSALWWLVLTGSISRARTRLSVRVQRIINLAAGSALVAFGVTATLSVLL